MAIKELEQEIQKLTEPEKKQIIRKLISDLDDSIDENVAQLWLEEAQRRSNELEIGVVKGISTTDAITDARDRLNNVRRTSS
jgi:hypothetical protein